MICDKVCVSHIIYKNGRVECILKAYGSKGHREGTKEGAE